jgi:DNA-binding CsgD family transcriptional regulator
MSKAIDFMNEHPLTNRVEEILQMGSLNYSFSKTAKRTYGSYMTGDIHSLVLVEEINFM